MRESKTSKPSPSKRKYPTYKELSSEVEVFRAKWEVLKSADVHAKLLKARGETVEGNVHLVLAVQDVLRSA